MSFSEIVSSRSAERVRDIEKQVAIELISELEFKYNQALEELRQAREEFANRFPSEETHEEQAGEVTEG